MIRETNKQVLRHDGFTARMPDGVQSAIAGGSERTMIVLMVNADSSSLRLAVFVATSESRAV